MKTKDVLTMSQGDAVQHTRYGACVVKEVMKSFGSLFGVQLLPQSAEGKALLRLDSGVTTDMPLLEGSVRCLKTPNAAVSGPAQEL